jgi:hypothetical protein
MHRELYLWPSGGDDRLMGARSLLILMVALFAAAGCADTLPDKAVLRPEAANVEIISEPPNREVYEPAGEVSAQIIGRDNAASLREAFNMLRNQAAAKGATFVAVEEVSSRAAWDFSGRTIVTLVGTAYRTK